MSSKSARLLSVPVAVSEVAPVGSGPQWMTTACMVASDGVTLTLLFSLAALASGLLRQPHLLQSSLDMALWVTGMLVAFWMQGLYPGALLHPAEEMRRTFAATAIICLVSACSGLFGSFGDLSPRTVLFVACLAAPPVVLAARGLTRSALSSMSWWGVSTIVLGSGPSAQKLIRETQQNKRGIRIAGVLTDEPDHEWPDDMPPILGSLALAPALAASGAAKYVVVALTGSSVPEFRHTVQKYCEGFRHVLLLPNIQGLCMLDVSAGDFGGELGFEFPQRLFHPSAALSKRCADVVLSGIGLLLLAPLLIVIAVLIRLGSPGPVFFGHPRKGRGGQTFRALKFRTMVPDGDHVLEEYLKRHPEHQMEWYRDRKLKNDPRVTAVGKWLRRFSLDEIPQLFNVLAGDMSLIGPRPIPLNEVSRYGAGYSIYIRVRPGLTGLWQVSGRNNTTYEARLAFDEFYLRNWSFWLDVHIMVRTVRAVLTADGAY